VPVLGLGVWQVPDGRDCVDAVRWALETGYRHVDTAQAYGNEESVGRALRDSGVPGRAYLDWTARALGLDIDGVTVLTVGPAGTFTSIAIHHQPFGAVLAFSREMGRRLDGLIEPGHFDPG
jgi:Aldo/keto reductase family